MALDFDWVTTHLFDRKIYIDPITLINMDGNMKNAPVNERHIRLSDLYLLYAEACVYAGGDAEGYLNKVRRRAELTGDWAGSSDILERIYHERRVELGSEPGTGWPDLKRTGRWKDTDLSYRVSAKVTRVFDGVTPPLGVRYEITGVEQEDVGTPKDDGLDFSGPTGETGVWIQEDYINEIPYKARTWYLPIPELEISNYGLEQNPGW